MTSTNAARGPSPGAVDRTTHEAMTLALALVTLSRSDGLVAALRHLQAIRAHQSVDERQVEDTALSMVLVKWLGEALDSSGLDADAVLQGLGMSLALVEPPVGNAKQAPE